MKTVFDTSFASYGRVLEGLELSSLLNALAGTEKPEDATVYVPSCPSLEDTAECSALQTEIYGGMEIQIGYCNGSNTMLNCLEYHRDSEVNVLGSDVIYLVAPLQSVKNGVLDTGVVEAFSATAGIAVELYATTLHYAPCNGVAGGGFRVAIVLPRGTNTEKPGLVPQTAEGRLLWAKNKWLIAHPESSEAAQGAHVGLTGINLDTRTL